MKANKEEIIGDIIAIATSVIIILAILNEIWTNGLDRDGMIPTLVVFGMWIGWFLCKLVSETSKMFNKDEHRKEDK